MWKLQWLDVKIIKYYDGSNNICFIKMDSNVLWENIDSSQILEYMNYILEYFQSFAYKLPISIIMLRYVVATGCFFLSQSFVNL